LLAQFTNLKSPKISVQVSVTPSKVQLAVEVALHVRTQVNQSVHDFIVIIPSSAAIVKAARPRRTKRTDMRRLLEVIMVPDLVMVCWRFEGGKFF